MAKLRDVQKKKREKEKEAARETARLSPSLPGLLKNNQVPVATPRVAEPLRPRPLEKVELSAVPTLRVSLPGPDLDGLGNVPMSVPQLKATLTDDKNRLRSLETQYRQRQSNLTGPSLSNPVQLRGEIDALKRRIEATQAAHDQQAEPLRAKLPGLKEERDEAQRELRQARGAANRAMRTPYQTDPLGSMTLERAAQEAANRAEAQREGYIDWQLNELGTLTPGSRMERGLRSVGTTIGAAVPAIWETGKQALKNTKAEWGNDDRGALRQEMMNLGSALLDAEYQFGKESRQYREIEARIAEVEQQLERTDPKQAVDMDSFGMRAMSEGQRMGQQALEGLTEGQQFLGSTAMSVAQNAAIMPMGLVNPSLPLAAMGGIAAANKMHELSGRGVEATQAFGRGALAGGIEALTEKLPLDSALDILTTGGKGTLRNILKQAGLEATEEGLSYAANWLADKAAGDAETFSMEEMLMSAAAGGLSGLFFGAGTSAVNAGANIAGNIRQQTADPRMLTPNLPQNAFALPDARKSDMMGSNNLPEVALSGQGTEAQIEQPGAGARGQNAGAEPWGGRTLSAGILQQEQGVAGNGARPTLAGSQPELGSDTGRSPDGLPALAERPRLEPGNAPGARGISPQALGAHQADAGRERYGRIAENQPDFLNRAARENKTTRQAGNQTFAYEQTKLPTAVAESTLKDLGAMGVEAFVYGGELQANNGNNTLTSRGEASTLPDGSVAIRNDMTMNPQNVAGHEMYHSRNRLGGGTQYYDAIVSNADYNSPAFQSFFQEIADNYFPGEFDYTKDGPRVWQEFAAYISGDLNQKTNQERNASMFKNWDAVIAAWQQMRDMGRQNGPVAAQEQAKELSVPKLGAAQSVDSLDSADSLLKSLEPQLKRLENMRTITVPTQELVAKRKAAKDARRALDSTLKRYPLSAHDQNQVDALVKGEITPRQLTQGTDLEAVRAVTEARQAYEEARRPVDQYNQARREYLRQEAQEVLADSLLWKDKKAGLLYSRETMERNIRDIASTPEAAQQMIDTYITPIHKNEAARNDMKNEYRDRVRELDLSRRVDRGNKNSEAYAVQFLGELNYDIQRLEAMQNPEATLYGRTLEDALKARQKFMLENPRMDWGKVNNAIEEFRQIYDELFEMMNIARVRNGYDPVDYRKGYFPHFTAEDGDGLMADFARAMGINMEVTALPTSINGMTHTFKPGMRWFGNALQRMGNETTFDAVQGFDRYIEGVSDVVHHTQDIQRLRTLANEIRYQASDKGIKEKMRAIMDDSSLTEDQKNDEIKRLAENARFNLSNFVVELDEYTNLLANKKAFADRNMERNLGRRFYNIAKGLENHVAANMVALNPGSWLTNYIPLTQGGAEVGTTNLVKGMLGTLKNYINDDGFVAQSSFLTNRRGSDPLVRSKVQDLASVMGSPMEMIDRFTADSLVRARYEQNVKKGMSQEGAMSETDSWVASVMADRSKGSMPTLFESRNPMAKLFTQFQLEANNQLSYLLKDIPRNQREKGMAALVAVLLRFAIGAYLFNDIYEHFVGRRPALDPIGMLNDLSGDLTGYKLPSLPEIGGEAIKGQLPSFETERAGLKQAGKNLVTNVLEDTPFVGSLMGGGRLPISSALPNLSNTWNAASDLMSGEGDARYNMNRLGKELAKPAAYVLPPFGGGQIKKAAEGISAAARSGSYTVDKEGRDILRFPVHGDGGLETAGNYLRGAVFGKMALPEAQGWVDSGFRDYSAEETAAYKQLLEQGVDSRAADKVLKDIRAAGEKEETEEKAEPGTLEGSDWQALHARREQDKGQVDPDAMTPAAKKQKALADAALSDDQKYTVYYNVLASDRDKVLLDFLTDNSDEAPGDVYRVMRDFSQVKTTEESKSRDQKMDILDRSGLSTEGQASIYLDKMASGEEIDRYLALADDTQLEAVQFYEFKQGTHYLSGEKDDKGKTINGTKAKQRYDYIEGMGLPENQATALFLSEVATDSFAEKYQESLKTAKALGMDGAALLGYMVDIGAMTSDKDKQGKTVPDSKRDKTWAYIDALPLDRAQKDFLHLSYYSDKTLGDAPWRNSRLRSAKPKTGLAGTTGGIRAAREDRLAQGTGASTSGLRAIKENKGLVVKLPGQ